MIGRHMSGIRLLPVFMLLGMLMALPGATSAQGNSEAAHACQQGGYASLVGARGETFANAGDCVSFAAQGGVFAIPGSIIVPAGSSVTFSNQVLSACNPLSFGYAVNGGGVVELGSKVDTGCGGNDTVFFGDVTVGPFEVDSEVTVVLSDLKCGAEYGMTGNHARLVANPPVYDVDIADAGYFCERVSSPVSFAGEGNLSLTVTVHD